MLLLGPPGGGKSTLVKNILIHQRPRFKEVFIIHEDHSGDPDTPGTTEYNDVDPTLMLNEVPGLDFWNSVCAEDDEDKPPVKRLVILDDLEMKGASHDRLKNLGILFRYVSSHKGFSLCLCHQDYFGLPTLLKKVANVFCIWRPHSRNELSLIENRCGLEKGLLKELFGTVATGARDSICVDRTLCSPAPLRLNLWTPIEVEGD
jgi:hypothetical protein